MSTIDQQFVEYIVKSIVGHPDDVKIERTIDEQGVFLKLTVNPEDLGRVIGKRGSTAQSIRTLLRALGTKNEARYNFKIIDPDGDNRPPREDRPPRDDTPVADDTNTQEQPSESAQVDKPVAEEPVADDSVQADQPVSEEAIADDEPTKPTEQGSLADKTRKELAELDDLDI